MTNTGGADELICSDPYGILLPDATPQSIAVALKAALSDDVWRKQAGQLLKRRVQEQFDWDVTAGRILARLEELTGEGAVQ
jgi:glycosyltransferase involved in cell wall biosynthesis